MPDIVTTGPKALFANTFGRLSAQPASKRLVLLCYHSVHESVPFATSPSLFDLHLRWLKEHCDVVRFEECIDWKHAATRPRVIITFDDGYLDNYQVALPHLLKFGMTAAFFITTGFIDGAREVIARLASGWQTSESALLSMSWHQLRELSAAGMTIGAHTRSHPVLGRMQPSEVLDEIVQSKTRLEEKLGQPATSMSYPYGRPGSAVVAATLEATAQAGYQLAAVVLSRGALPTDHPLSVPRFIVDGDSVETLRAKVLGWWDWIGRSREWVSGF